MPSAEVTAGAPPGRRLPFRTVAVDPLTNARAGELATPHGVVRTPAFMPVGTAGTVKGIAAWQLEDLAPEMVLSNTYHLLLRPGVERLGRLGGLHRLMGWSGPILTDSGGYQVFSLAGRRKVTEDGVTFQSHLDGSRYELTPESVLDAQMTFGVDVAMVLDECLAYPPDPRAVGPSVDRTLRWAERAAGHLVRRHGEGHPWRGGAFGIQQGAVDPVQRRRCTDTLIEFPFDGFAVGGLAVGEPSDVLHDAIAMCVPMLPGDRIRYLMGVGYPEDLVHAMGCGVDLFDCVLPTRSARTGKIFTSRGDLVIKHTRWADDDRPLDSDCSCPTCARYSRAALRHFFISREATSVVLLTVHNLHFYLSLMRSAREAIIAGRYDGFREGFARARARGADDGGSEK